MSDLNYHKEINERIRAQLLETLKNYEIEGRNKILRISNPAIKQQVDAEDLTKQKDIKLKDKSFTDSLDATVSLIDKKTGKVLDRKKQKLMNVPVMTPRHSFIQDGTEYQGKLQLRLKPGVYTRIKDNQEVESQFNLEQGTNFKLALDPEKAKVMLEMDGAANVSLYPILKELGISDLQMEHRLGGDLLSELKKQEDKTTTDSVKKMYEFYNDSPPPSREDAVAWLKRFFQNTKIDPDVSALTLGEKFDSVTPKALLTAAQKLVNVSRGDVEPDNRENMIFKKTYDVVDILQERLTKKLRNYKNSHLIKHKLDRADDVDRGLPRAELRGLTDKFMLESGLVNATEQTNPLSMIESPLKATITGEGGITNSHAITEDSRLIHDSQMGLLDPVHTPASSLVGAAVGTTTGTKKVDNSLAMEVVDAKTGKVTHKTPEQLQGIAVGLPDQHKPGRDGKLRAISNKIYALLDNKMQKVKSSDVKYFMPDSRKMFGLATNLVPFAQANHANRAQMSAKLLEQAVSLINRDTPLVQTIDPDGKPYVTSLGEHYSTRSPVSGTISKIRKGIVEILDSKGNKTKLSLYDNFPLNRQTDLHSDLRVEEGQKVEVGDLIADTNFTRDGDLAMGKNLHVAYLPYKGLTYEDGIVISESAAEKLKSRHTSKVTQSLNPQLVHEKSKYVAYFPKAFDSTQLSKLDEDGVIKEGSEVTSGDPLILTMLKDDTSEEAKMLKKFKRALVSPYRNRAHTWKGTFTGKVTNVSKTPSAIHVYITTEAPAVVGDKLVSSHANKGIITGIIPDAELPHTKDGRVPDIMYSPLSIPSRVNPSQLIEVAASKLAEKTGKPIQIENFSKENVLQEIRDKLKKEGLSADETFYDPKTGKAVGTTASGSQYTYKLHHVVEDKMSSRYLGGYDMNEQPTAPAQNFGMHDMHALLAYGMKDNLKEMATHKSGRNDEFWRNLQIGGPLPKPKPSFAFDKFLSYLKVLGVDTTRDNDHLVLMPLSNKEIRKMSKGKVDDTGMVRGKNLEPMKQGLFDENTAGGLNGKNWTHVDLNESIPNPVYTQPIAHLLDVTKAQLEDVIADKKYMDKDGNIVSADHSGALSGSKAIKRALDNVGKTLNLNELKQEATSAKGTKLNKLHKKIRYLTALNKTGLSPSEAYMTDAVPVLPPNMRPIFPGEDGSVRVSSLNYLYRDLILANKQLSDTQHLPQDIVGEIRIELYKALKALQGLGSPITKLPTRDVRGIMQIVANSDSTQAKEGFVQASVFKRPQELSGRSTITLGLNMHPDEIGIPEEMAWDLFKPFTVKELVKSGHRPNQAVDLVESRDAKARKALEVAIKDRLVLSSRAPVLHKYGYQAFKPVIHDGKDIKVHPLTMAGPNADLDGDCTMDSCFLVINRNLFTAALEGANLEAETWLTERSIQMPANVRLPLLEDECVIHAHLEDFPRIAGSKSITNKGTIVYKVPSGISVITLDNETCQPVKVPVTEFSIHPNLNSYYITTNDNSNLWVSEDHSLVAYDLNSLSITPVKPTELTGKALPKVKKFNIPETVTNIKLVDFAGPSAKIRVKPEVDVTEDLGYLIGIMVGDGWVSRGDTSRDKYRFICLAGNSHAIAKSFVNGVSGLLSEDKVSYTKGTMHMFGEHACYSEKHTISSLSLAGNFERWIGTGAANKHLPAWYLSTPVEFKLGLLAGLLDTDGSCYWAKAEAKNKKQFMVSYSTISPRLAQEVVTLCRSLGVRCSITECSKEYRVNLSSTDIHGLDLNLKHENKVEDLREFQSTPLSKNSLQSQATKYDKVPFGPTLLDIAKTTLKEGMRKKNRDKAKASLYAIASRSAKKGTIPRITAKRLIELGGNYPPRWVDVVSNENVTWVIATSIEKAALPVTMYDITAPGPYTFMTSSGIIIQDTYALHVPVSPAAVKDAAKALPSRNLIGPKSGELMMSVDKESALGVFKLTNQANAVESNLSYSSATELVEDLKAGNIIGNELVKLNGKKTMAGRAVVERLLGETLPPGPLNKKAINNILKQKALAKDPTYTDTINDLEHIGFEAAWRIEGGIKFSDLTTFLGIKDKELTKLLPKLDKMPTRQAADTLKATLDRIITDNISKLQREKNSVYEMMDSGARGNLNQFKQMVVAPGFTIDARNNVIPVPVTRSYAEGLPFHQYWSAMHGGRKGTVETQLATAGPGELYKQALNSTEREVVTINDCNATEGLSLETRDTDALDRYLAMDAKAGNKVIAKRGDLVTSEVMSQAAKAKVKVLVVRTPVFCKAAEGVCATCYGLTENGDPVKIGTHVGVIAAHSITEPLTQMMLSSKHTGGVYTGKEHQFAGIKPTQRMLTLPKVFPDKSVLSKVKGRVQEILKNPAGGWNIIVDNKKHFTLTNPNVKIGDNVGKGDPLSGGLINPRDILQLKGLDATKRFLAERLKKLYADGGATVSGRHLDTMVKAMTNVAQVIDPGDSNHLPGDITTTSDVRHFNKHRKVEGKVNDFVGARLAVDTGRYKAGTLITENVAKDIGDRVTQILRNKIKYRPEIAGINLLPLTDTDWLSRLNYNRLKDTIMEGSAMRWESHLHGVNPIPAFMYGSEFGDPGEDSPNY